MKKILFLNLIVSSSVFAQVSYISNTDTLNEGGTEFDFESNYFLSSNKVDPIGDASAFNTDESFETLNLSMKGGYAFTDKFLGHIGANFRLNQSNQLINNEVTSERASGLESIRIGFKYNWQRNEGFQYAMLGEYQQRLYSVDTFNDSSKVKGLVLGDSGPLANFGFAMNYQTKSQNYLSAKLLYQNPGSELSSEILSEFEAAAVWKKMSIFVGLQNISSMNQDPFFDDINAKPLIARGNTELFNSINRSMTSGYMGLNISMGKTWMLGLKVANTFNAVSSDLGTNFILNFTKRTQPNSSFKKIDQTFKEYRVEASVSKISKTRNVVVIDKGIDEGLKKGMSVDFYFFDYLGGNELIATGIVVEVSGVKAMVKITKRYSKKRVEEGTVARAGLIKD